jgi:hypothetical protein
METFKAHRLRFVTEVKTTIELNEHQGSAIRGALFHAMRARFCGNKKASQCAACPLVSTCPVATLLSTVKPGSERGRDVPRPYTVQPPLPGDGGHPVEDDFGRLFFRYRPGESFAFGLTLFAQALQLFPYVVLTIKTFEDAGLGRRVERKANRWRRGTLDVRKIWAENPLSGDRQPVFQGDDDMVNVPDVPITHEQILRRAEGWLHDRGSGLLAIEFQTPTRLIEDGSLVKPHDFRFKPLLQRLLDRQEALSRDFSQTRLDIDFSGIVTASERVRVVDNRLWWEELRSYSTRRRSDSPTSGLLGGVVLKARDWTPFLPYLTWGQFTHVGKDATKGNGWYRIRPSLDACNGESLKKC